MSRTMEDIPPCSRLYISLGSGFNPTNLRELLESYGRVEEFKAPRKTNAKGEVRQRGFAFVKFFKTSDAAAALEGLDGTEFENLTLKVSVAGNITNIIPRYLFFTDNIRSNFNFSICQHFVSSSSEKSRIVNTNLNI